MVELAPRNMAQTIEKVPFAKSRIHLKKCRCMALKSLWEPHGLTEGLAFFARLLNSKMELRRQFPRIFVDGIVSKSDNSAI